MILPPCQWNKYSLRLAYGTAHAPSRLARRQNAPEGGRPPAPQRRHFPGQGAAPAHPRPAPASADSAALALQGIYLFAIALLGRLVKRHNRAIATLAVEARFIGATEDFRSSGDLAAQFLADRCQPNADKRAPAGQLYDAYAA